MKNTILITGGKSGIGAALAELFEGNENLYLTGSRPSNDGQDQHYLVADQNDAVNAAQSIVDGFTKAGIEQLDLAILNAGIGYWRHPSHETSQEIRGTLDVNIASTMVIAHQLFPLLKKAHGKLVILGSTSYNGQPNLATYAASKAALDGLARALRSEWQGRVQVQIIHPGPTNTAMHGKAGLDIGRMGGLFASPQLTAKMTIKAIESERLRTSFTLLHRLSYSLSRGWIG
jgi:short-subunit dehydrogenase